jgi:hypothetical protein
MTLVVARQIDSEVYIVGDTKFTDDAESETDQYVGGLKVVLLTPGLCVAFAGDVANAKKAIQGIYDKDVNLFDKNLLLEYFLKHHKDSQPDSSTETTFIVVVIVQFNEQPEQFLKEIFRISDSKIHWENETTHIGDSEAFNFFQKASHEGDFKSEVPNFEISRLGLKERPKFDASVSTAMRAMQSVINSQEIKSVDGYRTVVISENDQFRYIEYVQIQGKAVPIGRAPGSPVTFGGAPEGTDAKHVGMFSATGHGVFPVYSITGRFGLIYHPEENFAPTPCPKCSMEEFRAAVKERISAAHQRALQYQSKF